jgi:hypothetical protein
MSASSSLSFMVPHEVVQKRGIFEVSWFVFFAN